MARLGRASAASALTIAICAVLVSPAGAKTRTKTYSSGPLAAPIVNETLNLFPLASKAKGKVKKVRVSVRIVHAYDSDLSIYLVSPGAKFVQLSNHNGGSDNDYGAGPADCTGTLTAFDDAAPTPITTAAAPFAGAFKPQQPLSALNKSKAKGQWQLLIGDDDPADTGTLACWELTIASKTKKR